jgi:uncharacterized protein
MINIRRFLLLSLFYLISTASKAQDKSLLWEVTGKGLPAPSYIFGTVHVICAQDFTLKDKVMKAFDRSSRLVLEVDLTDSTELKTAQKMMMSPTKLSSHLTPAEQLQLDSSLQKHYNIRLAQVENLEPIALESMMALKAVSCTDRKMYEMELIQRAREQKKPIGKLETMAEQISYLKKGFTASDMVRHLQLVPEYSRYFSEMISHYKNEDLESLNKFAVDHRFMNDTSRYWLLDVRNNNWADIMPSMMQEGSVFFAVGAIHLVGEKGILALLKTEGYTVKPVFK